MALPRFRSSRDPRGGSVDFETAVRQGLAPDGGLYLPDRIPTIETGWQLVGSPAEATVHALAPWFGDDDRAAWTGDAAAALDFPLPLRKLDDGVYLLELFHGPTRAFKDVAARTLGRWWARSLAARGERAVVLVATSGDTGGAVVDGMAGIEGLDVVVLFPEDGVSEVQRAQLTAARPGVHAFALRGSFDDAQRLVKEAFADPELQGLPLTSANSINLGRWLPQTSIFLWGLASLGAAGEDAASSVIAVPSGNLGHLTAGLLMAAMGAAPARFLAAHNANRYLPDWLGGARVDFDFPATVATMSNAMDVGAPSNFERLRRLWPSGTPVPLSAASVDDQATEARIRSTFERFGVVVCPHTAVGLEAVARDRAHGGARSAPYLVMATAHPAKFPEVTARALPGVRVEDPLLATLAAAPKQVVELPPTLPALRAALLAIAA